MPKNVQIRNVDDDTYKRLRARADAQDLSLTQYLRRELEKLADMPTMEELLARADARRTLREVAPASALTETIDDYKHGRD
jgi:antitoxin FitA